MIRINLLPVRAARKKENIRWQISVFFLCIFFVLVVMAYLYVGLTKNITVMNDRITEAEAELKRLQAISKQVNQIKAKCLAGDVRAEALVLAIGDAPIAANISQSPGLSFVHNLRPSRHGPSLAFV